MTANSHHRHIAKTITWRIIGTLDTIILGWFFTGKWDVALSIGGFELITKMILYYLHERIWFRIHFKKATSSYVRHMLKTFTWRFFGTVDTIFLGWLVTGNIAIGISIGSFEILTKMVLYYLHERVWYQSRFGLPKERT